MIYISYNYVYIRWWHRYIQIIKRTICVDWYHYRVVPDRKLRNWRHQTVLCDMRLVNNDIFSIYITLSRLFIGLIDIHKHPGISVIPHIDIFLDRSLRERPLDFQGGAWVFQSGQNIFFCHFQGQNIFFQTIMSQNIFSQAILGQNIFFYTIQIWKQLFSWAANRLHNYYIEVVCCLSVCVSDRDDFKWHNIANSKYIAIPLYMRVYTTDVSCYWNFTLWGL